MILFNSIVSLIIIIVPTLPFLIGSSSDDWMIGTRVCQKDTDCDWACELGVCLPFNNAPNDSCKKTAVCRKVKGKQICVVTVRGWCETDDDCSKMMCGGGKQSSGCPKWWCDKKQTKGNRCTTKRPKSGKVRKISAKQHVSSEDLQIRATPTCQKDGDCGWECHNPHGSHASCFPFKPSHAPLFKPCKKTKACDSEWLCDKNKNDCTLKRPKGGNVRTISTKPHVSSEDWQIGTRSCKNDADCTWVCSGLCFPYNIYSCRKTSVCREVLGKKVCVLAAKGWCENDDDCSKLVCGKSKDPNCSKWWCEKNKGKANMCTDKWRSVTI